MKQMDEILIRDPWRRVKFWRVAFALGVMLAALIGYSVGMLAALRIVQGQ